MKQLLVALALMLFCVTPSHADTQVARSQRGDIAKIHDTPCENGKVLAEVERQLAAAGMPMMPFQAGQVYLAPEDKWHDVCWAMNPVMDVVIVHEDGSAFSVPLSHFAPVGAGI